MCTLIRCLMVSEKRINANCSSDGKTYNSSGCDKEDNVIACRKSMKNNSHEVIFKTNKTTPTSTTSTQKLQEERIIYWQTATSFKRCEWTERNWERERERENAIENDTHIHSGNQSFEKTWTKKCQVFFLCIPCESAHSVFIPCLLHKFIMTFAKSELA